MNDQNKTKPQTTTGGPLDIHEQHVTPIVSDADLKGKVTPGDRQPQTKDQDRK